MFVVVRPELAWSAAIAKPSSRRTTARKNAHRLPRLCRGVSSSSEERTRDPSESPWAYAGDARGNGHSKAVPCVSKSGSPRAPAVWPARGPLSRKRDCRRLRRSRADDRSEPRRQEPGSTRSTPLESNTRALLNEGRRACARSVTWTGNRDRCSIRRRWGTGDRRPWMGGRPAPSLAPPRVGVRRPESSSCCGPRRI
jgi:hypothetical protein